MLSLLALPSLLLPFPPIADESAAARQAEPPPPAASAQEVRPLLPGAAVPAATVTVGEESLDLAAFAAEGPTIFVFYRGGW